jgi:hypothetical protein
MKSILLRYFIAILIISFTISCSNKDETFESAKASSLEKSKSTQNQIPKTWEKIFFREITERINGSEIKNLRDIEISPNSIEVRIWVGFDLSPLRGLILRQNNGEWTALYVPPIDSSDLPRLRPYLLQPPKSGWESLWERLKSLEILTLPDATEIGLDDKSTFDSRGVVIEIKTKDSYRTYLYFGLNWEKRTEEQRKVFEICNTLSEEFGLHLYYYFGKNG